LGEREPQKPFRTLELNLLLTGGWQFAPEEASKPVSMANLQHGRLHRKKALASRNSSVGSIIIAFCNEPCSKNPSPDNDYSTGERKEKVKRNATYSELFHFAD